MSAGSGRSRIASMKSRCSSSTSHPSASRLRLASSRARPGEIDPVVVRDASTVQGADHGAGIAAGEIEQAKRLPDLVGEHPMQDPVDLGVIEVVVVDELLVHGPLPAEQLQGLLVGHRRGKLVTIDVDSGRLYGGRDGGKRAPARLGRNPPRDNGLNRQPDRARSSAGFHRLTPLRDTHPGLSPTGPAAPRTPAARYPPRADWRRSAA